MKYAIAAYVLLSVFTFGHASVTYETNSENLHRQWVADNKIFGATMFPPLYWSVRLNEWIAAPHPTTKDQP